VKLTTARYYTPQGRSIQARGIVPDMMVDESADGDGMNSLRVREADLQKHLGNEGDKAGAPAASPKRDELEEERRVAAAMKSRQPLEFGGKDDFQLAQALNHFKGLPVKLSKVEPALETTGSKAAPEPELKPPELKRPAPNGDAGKR
jgi:carboxyl-terminal processing protease